MSTEYLSTISCEDCIYSARVYGHQSSRLECRRHAPQPNMDPNVIEPGGRSSPGVYPVPEGPCGDHTVVQNWIPK